jgi:hypothetical protein
METAEFLLILGPHLSASLLLLAGYSGDCAEAVFAGRR